MAYVFSIAKTNKLYCSDCKKRIKAGDEVIFLLSGNMKMKQVWGECCSEYYSPEAITDAEHPFSSDALGQC